MAALTWDQVGERLFETGVSKGVLYQSDGTGVAWNGLTSIEEDTGNSVDPVFFDGVKFDDIVTIGDFSAQMRAFTYPDEFLQYEGTLEDQTGFYITGQPTSKFSLSYQTRVGDDIHGVEGGYKIHILYNLTATPSRRDFKTVSDNLDPIEFEWDLTSVPEEIEYFRPTAHVIIDSRKFDSYLLADVEEILYGSEDNPAHLPSLKGLSTFIRKWVRLIVIDNGDGTWTATSDVDGDIIMLDADTFQIDSEAAVFIDSESYTLTSTEKNEEDVWLP